MELYKKIIFWTALTLRLISKTYYSVPEFLIGEILRSCYAWQIFLRGLKTGIFHILPKCGALGGMNFQRCPVEIHPSNYGSLYPPIHLSIHPFSHVSLHTSIHLFSSHISHPIQPPIHHQSVPNFIYSFICLAISFYPNPSICPLIHELHLLKIFTTAFIHPYIHTNPPSIHLFSQSSTNSSINRSIHSLTISSKISFIYANADLFILSISTSQCIILQILSIR